MVGSNEVSCPKFEKSKWEITAMRPVLSAMICIAICPQLVAQDKRDPFSIKFNDLSLDEQSELASNTGEFFRNRLLAEADSRRVDPEVKKYLQISLAAWIQAISDDADSSNAIIEAAKKGDLDPRVAVAVLKDRPSLLTERYFAKATSKNVPFGQFIVEGKVLQVIDDKNMIATVRPIGGDDFSTIWIDGISTKGLFDDASLDLTFFATRLWQLSGTKSYTNTAGAKKTVPHLRFYPLDMNNVTAHIDLFEFGKHWNSFESLLNASADQKKKDEVEAERAAKTRIWRDASGTFSVEAEFRGVIGDRVLLKKKDGKLARVPLVRLSEDDQKWIEQRGKTKKQ